MRWRGSALVVALLGLGTWIACSSSDSDVAGTPADAGADTDSGHEPSLADATDPTEPVDATLSDAALDAGSAADADADADLGPLVRFAGGVDFNGSLEGALVELLAPTQDSIVTDETGNFAFYAPQHSLAVVRVTPPADAGAYPMIRGVVVEPNIRIRILYLEAKSDLATAQSALGFTVDPSKAIVEVDFRGAKTGGYGATMKDGTTTLTPGYGVAYDDSNTPVESLLTVTGGDGTTQLYGNVAPGNVSFTPIFPADAGLPCTPCDAPTLPIQAGVVTWFDFECSVNACQ